MTVLAVDSVVAGYGAAEAILKGCSLRLDANEIVCVIGPNGAGKSTLLKTIAGLVPATAGRIALNGADLGGMDAAHRSRRGIGFVPQERNVFAAMTVADNLSISCFEQPGQARARTESMYARYPMLARKRRALARTLSGGERQILAMAMGLMQAPSVLLLDEPTAGLSPVARRRQRAVRRDRGPGPVRPAGPDGRTARDRGLAHFDARLRPGRGPQQPRRARPRACK